MDDLNIKKIATPSKQEAFSVKGFFGQCNECGHIGLDCFPCAKCKGDTMEIIE